MTSENRENPVPGPHSQGQPPVINLAFLDNDSLVGKAGWYEPLTRQQVAILLDEAAKSADDFRRVSRIEFRLACGMQDTSCQCQPICRCQVKERETVLHRLFTSRYREGADPGLVAELCSLLGTGQEAAAALTERRFTVLDGIPPQDDPELTALMEAVRRLPRDRADTEIESTLRCALGYQRTGNPEFLTSLASSAPTTFRVRRDPENQKALDAVPADPSPASDATDLDEVFARLGLRPAQRLVSQTGPDDNGELAVMVMQPGEG